jgi:hypothetical protein
MKIELTIHQLEALLNEQKSITIEKFMEHSYNYNLESTEGNLKTLPIDKDKFTQQGMKARFPNDFEILKKYISN